MSAPPTSDLQITVSTPPGGEPLAIVIPAYNEAGRLPATLDRIAAYRPQCPQQFEVVVVDDGSRDQTRQVALDFAMVHPWARLLTYDVAGAPCNRGKGFAVRQGVLATAARFVLFSDADLSTPIEDVEKLLEPVVSGDCAVAIASRALPGSVLAVHQPWYREMMGRAFNLAVQGLAVPGIHDTQCGFKLFEGTAARRIFALARIDGFGFDPEILFLARKLGYQVREVPVTWRHQEASRVSPLLAPWGMLRELLTIRCYQLRGMYGSGRDASPR